jgi:hypothetical protein
VSSIDQQFIEFVVKSLVGNPDAVQVTRRIDEKGVLLELTVDPEDLGRVIGKRGATAQSLRTLLRALGTKNDARYNLKIIDNGAEVSTDGEGATAPSDAPAKTRKTKVTDTDDDNASDSSSSDDASKNDADDNQTSERLRQTRQELADLDDLDV